MLSETFTFEKLLEAHKKCRRSKQHKSDTISFEINLSTNLINLSKNILNNTYKVGKYKQFYVYEPKARKIEALSYRDRLVLMAFCTNIIEPKVEKRLIYDNVACRKGKGTMFGIDRLHKFLRDFYNKYRTNEGYCLKCDIKKYFQNIDHNILKQYLIKAGLDNEDMQMIQKILDSRYAAEQVGLPIGNQTSQWFGLFYLNVVDRYIKEKLRVKYYVRYMDDMILIHKDKEFLKKCRQEIESIVKEKLNLELNSKTQICRLKDGIDFLGFRHITESGKIITLLRGSSKIRLKHKLRKLRKLKDKNLVDHEFVNTRLRCYNAFMCHANTKKLYYLLKKKQHFTE